MQHTHSNCRKFILHITVQVWTIVFFHPRKRRCKKSRKIRDRICGSYTDVVDGLCWRTLLEKWRKSPHNDSVTNVLKSSLLKSHQHHFKVQLSENHYHHCGTNWFITCCITNPYFFYEHPYCTYHESLLLQRSWILNWIFGRLLLVWLVWTKKGLGRRDGIGTEPDSITFDFAHSQKNIKTVLNSRRVYSIVSL